MIFGIPIPVLIFLGVAALVVIGIAANAYAERKRRESVGKVADELGLSFHPDGDPALVSELSDFPLFSKGRAKQIKNMIHGETDEVIMGIFDYRYTTGSGKSQHTYRQTVAFFRSVDLHLPDFELRPQGFFHGIGKVFGYKDFDFESHPVFSKAFVLRGQNEKRTRQLFSPEILTALEGQQGINVEGRGTDLIFYRDAKRSPP